MVDPLTLGLVSAVTALVASIFGPFVTLYIARTQIRATVIAANRQKWIDAFRETIATFCSQVAAIVQVREKIIEGEKIRLSADLDVLHKFEALIYTLTKIRLMTDPLDEQHLRLLGIMEGLLSAMRTAPVAANIQPEIEATARQVTDLSLVILRREWVRVKRLS
jgi:hypothetical protein